MPTYVLPDLDYDFGALEPHISGEIMELHHDKHHKAYVEKANETLEKLDEARDKQRLHAHRRAREGAGLQPLRPRAALDLLEEPAPGGGDAPRGELAPAIARDFGSFDAVQGPAHEGRGDDHGLGLGRRSCGSRSRGGC